MNAESGNRYAYKFNASTTESREVIRPLIREVAHKISTLTGGCNVTENDGYWVEGCDTYTDNPGILQRENNWMIEVSTLDDELEFLRECFRPLVPHCQWIHCEVSTIQAAHFDIS
jgi:hypothetical protein